MMHNPDTKPDKRSAHKMRLLGAFLINIVIAVAEFIGGLLTGSLALMSDAVHNLADGFSILVSYLAFGLASRKPDSRNTFGYKRIEILAAAFNAALLAGICVFLVYEAIQRFLSPKEVDAAWMGYIAVFGLLANLAGVILLKKPSHGNMNIRSAYLHLLGDALSSVAVIVGALLLFMFHWLWIDPLITLIVSVYILVQAWKILRQAVDVLMMAIPPGYDLNAISHRILTFDPVMDVHHLHLWRLNDDTVHFECHIRLAEDISLSGLDQLRIQIEEILKTEFQLQHITLQMEKSKCHYSGRHFSAHDFIQPT